MKVPFLFLMAAFITSCATRQPLPESNDPFQKSFVADVQTITNETDLKQLIKTLPVWENNEPGFIDGWIDRMGKLKGNTLTIAGDGAQIALRLTRLPAEGLFELEGGTADWPEGGRFLYHLKRLDKGWQVLSRKTP